MVPFYEELSHGNKKMLSGCKMRCILSTLFIALYGFAQALATSILHVLNCCNLWYFEFLVTALLILLGTYDIY